MARSIACCAALAALVAAACPARPAAAQQLSFAGKTIRMIIGFGPGGGYDIWGRTVARYLGRHLPGDPTVVSENMPGAGSYVAATYIYNVAPRDGTVMAIIARDAPLGPITGEIGARFDPLKMSWLGTPTTETNVCIAEKTARVKNYADLRRYPLIVGDTGPGTGTHSYPKALNALLGLKFKLIAGFTSTADVFLAMERGELEGICESLDSVVGRRPTWIASGQVNVLFQGGAEPDPSVKAPFVLDFAKTDHDRRAIRFLYAGQGIGRPFVAPPGLSPTALATLRAAFDATMKDPGFIADVKREKLDLHPKNGAYLTALMQSVYATPKSIVQEVGRLIND